MNPEPGKRPETHIADFSDVLSCPNGDDPPVIVGGHAVNLWATYFLSHDEDALSKYLPFTSKDLDLVGTWDLLERLHQRLKGGTFPFRAAQSCFGKVGGHVSIR
jgi:hypothetical protein